MVQLKLNRYALLFLSLAVITFGTGLFLLTTGFAQKNNLYLSAITIDLTITTSFFIFLFLKKQKINPLIVGPLFILLLLTARLLIPSHQQFTLQFIIEFVAPAVELSIIGVVIWKITKARKSFLSLEAGDFQRKLEKVLFGMVNNKLASKLAGSELSMFYYLLFKWKKNEGYTYHKNSGIVTIIVAITLVAIAETAIVHILLMKYAPIFSWVLFWISVYSVLQLVSLAKAVSLRSIFHDSDTLYLHYGWLMSCDLAKSEIDSIEVKDIKELAEDNDFVFMGLIKDTEEKGVLITTKNTVIISKMFLSKKTKRIFIPVDEATLFIEEFKN